MTLETIYQNRPFCQLSLYIQHANGTMVILSGEEAYSYFYNKIATDIYNERKSQLDTTNARIEKDIKMLLSWFVFYLLYRMVFYVIKRLIGASKKSQIHVVVNDHR